MEKKSKNTRPSQADMADDWDFSEGFGGIPDDADLTKNIGCASSAPKPTKKNKPAK